jgi:RNA polymerase sigma-54 factor
MNPSTQPRVHVNQTYAGMLGGRSPGHATLRAQLQEARWLLKSLEIRQDTLMRVSRSIVERQIAFLEQGEEFMKPMILRDIAESIEMHESTVSRITSAQVHAHAAGVFELRYFFSSHVGRGRRQRRNLLYGHPRQDPQADPR